MGTVCRKMKRKIIAQLARLLTFVLLLLLLEVDTIRAQYLQSPCPNVFEYRMDPTTRQIFGYIEISNIQVGQAAKLNVDLSIGTELPRNNVGSIVLVKSREATFNDIVNGLPALYRVNFPLQNIIPTVLSIALNGQTLCTGYPAHGRIITTINLEHTLYTQLQTQNLAQNNGFIVQRPGDTNTIIYQPSLQRPRPSTQLQPQFPPQTQPVVIQAQPQPQQPPVLQSHWGFEPQTQRPQMRPIVERPDTQPVAQPPVRRTTVAPPLTSFSCGKPSSALFNNLAINGELVAKGQFPWVAPLFDRTQPRNPKYICGSTIINKKHLITAAHCLYEIDEFIRPERILAVPGMYNIDNFFDENAKIADIDAVIPHDDYVQEDDLNDADVAVLRLKREITYTDYIIPICLWQGENDLSKIVDQEGLVAGWGITESGTTSIPTYIKTTIVDRRQCSVNLQRMYPSNARIFCGDGHGSAPCNGDSGSGLVLRRGNQYYLRGVVSKGQVDQNTLKCDVTKYAIYTDIAPFRFWLKSVVS